MKYRTFLCILLLSGFFPSAATRASVATTVGIYFDATNPHSIFLGNDYYEISISQTNGALLYILDKATGEHVSAGSRYGCLWGSVFEAVAQPDDYVGGCLYHRDNPERAFTWEWHPMDSRLTLRYLQSTTDLSFEAR